MSFFDRRSGTDRRTDKKMETPDLDGPDKRKGNDRRSWKDRRLDRYHQMETSKRRAIYQIIEMLERDAGE